MPILLIKGYDILGRAHLPFKDYREVSKDVVIVVLTAGDVANIGPKVLHREARVGDVSDVGDEHLFSRSDDNFRCSRCSQNGSLLGLIRIFKQSTK